MVLRESGTVLRIRILMIPPGRIFRVQTGSGSVNCMNLEVRYRNYISDPDPYDSTKADFPDPDRVRIRELRESGSEVPEPYFGSGSL
jgi:hypothetical protein